MKGRTSRANTSLLDSIGLELLKADPGEPLTDNNLRIEYIPAELVRPDPIQPRRVLSEQLQVAFHDNQLTPVQALRELVRIAQVAARQHGHPFDSILDLLKPVDEDADEVAYSPEEQLVRDLANLAITLRNDGQVNPLTVVDVTQGVTRLYRIETGERRYWATWMLREFLPEYQGDGTIPCIIIPSGRASAFRQAKENTARSGLSAIAMARQAALLVLTVHGIERPEGPVSNDFYRQALECDLRGKAEFTAEILTAMGGITKSQLSRYKALLNLSDEALELADRYDIDEFRLRFVLNLASQDQAEMIRQIIQFNLSGKQVQDLCSTDSGDHEQPNEVFSRSTLQLVRIIRTVDASTAKDVAQALLRQEKDINIARARIQSLKTLIAEAEQYLSIQ